MLTDRQSIQTHTPDQLEKITWHSEKKRIQPEAQRSHPPHKNQPTGIFREIYTLLLKIDIFVEKDFATVLYASASEV